MANKDKKNWLNLFYDNWLYQPYDKLRKSKNYGGKTSLKDALSNFLTDHGNAVIWLLFPEGRCKAFKSHVIIFPQDIRLSYKNFQRVWEVENPVYYDGTFYSLDEFISDCPKLDPSANEHIFR